MEDIKAIVSQNKEVKEFVKSNNLSIDDNLIPLFSYVSKKKKCDLCKGLFECNQAIKGKGPILVLNNQKIEISFEECSYQKYENEENEIKNNLKLISCTFDNYDFKKIEINDARKNLLSKIKTILLNLNVHSKGLYVYGKYGCGKSYLLAYLAIKLSESGKKVIFAYYPDLVRRIKSSITTGKLEEIVEELKDVDCLFLDDFGGEQNSEFIRDEVLGAVLQERMTNNLFTCITSNISPNLLVDHLSNGNKEIDVIKASRIYERIKTLMEFIELDDKNYR